MKPPVLPQRGNQTKFFLKNKFIYFIYLFLAALGLRCCVRAFCSCSEWGPLLIAVHRLLIAVASCCRAWALGTWASVVVARGLQSTASAAVAHWHSCSRACGIFLDQGSNPHPLHWQADSQPLHHQGSPRLYFLRLAFKN